MATTLITRLGHVAELFRKAIAVQAVILSPNGAARYDATTAPTITAGTGAPTADAPDGSVYTRTDAADADNSFYVRVQNAWGPLSSGG